MYQGACSRSPWPRFGAPMSPLSPLVTSKSSIETGAPDSRTSRFDVATADLCRPNRTLDSHKNF